MGIDHHKAIKPGGSIEINCNSLPNPIDQRNTIAIDRMKRITEGRLIGLKRRIDGGNPSLMICMTIMATIGLTLGTESIANGIATGIRTGAMMTVRDVMIGTIDMMIDRIGLETGTSHATRTNGICQTAGETRGIIIVPEMSASASGMTEERED